MDINLAIAIAFVIAFVGAGVRGFLSYTNFKSAAKKASDDNDRPEE